MCPIRNTPARWRSGTRLMASTSVLAMTDRRRPRGGAVGSFALFARVSPEAAQVADDVARRLGVSKAEFVETVMLHVGATLDERGRPPWWTKPVTQDEELKLQAS